MKGTISKWKGSNISLKKKMTGILMITLIPVIVGIAAIFWQTSGIIKKQSGDTLYFNAKEIMSKIDDTIANIYSVSDTFANEQRLLTYLDTYYGEEKKIEKQQAVNVIIRRLFNGYNLLRENEQIGAIYTWRGELFNFIDAQCDTEEYINKLLSLDIDNPEKLSQFYWYPLQENFLTRMSYDDIRKDKVIIGSRRIYSRLKTSYPYIHLFVLRESSLYSTYENNYEQTGDEIYIINKAGMLLSSSNLEAVKAGEADRQLIEAVMASDTSNFEYKENGPNQLVGVAHSEINDWMTIIVSDATSNMRIISALYKRIAWLLIICSGAYIFILIYLYQAFMTPILRLNQSMHEVHQGKLDAYVEVTGNSEIAGMMQAYNRMLKSIGKNIRQRLAMQRKKEELEMEVLMSQINPHFLYNTLETIVWKAQTAKAPEIGRIAASLGRLYRITISDGRKLISIHQELEHVTAYIRIQERRYEGQFTFDLRADYSVLRNYYILKIILQPIVENSFLYGMKTLDHRMTIRISFYIKETTIKIVIADNGRGMSKTCLEEVRNQMKNGRQASTEKNSRQSKSSGIGLNNVYARLMMYFHIKEPVRIFSKENKGTVTVIYIPKLTDSGEPKGENNHVFRF